MIRKSRYLLGLGVCELALCGLFVLSLSLGYLGCAIYTGVLSGLGIGALLYISLT